MKKAIIIVIALLILATTAYAEVDYSVQSTEELQKQYDLIRNELMKRGLIADGKTILFDQDGVSVYLTGEHKIRTFSDGEVRLQLEAVVINNSNTEVSVGSHNGVSVNGWDVEMYGITHTNPGKKQKDYFDIKINEADITSYEEVEEIEFRFYIYYSDKSKETSYVEPFTVYFSDL